MKVCCSDSRAGRGTHSALSLSLVALDFGLKLVDQLLHPQQSLPVLLSLQEHTKPVRLQNQQQSSTIPGTRSDLVRQLLDSPLVAADSFLVLVTPLLLHHQLRLQLPHLHTQMFHWIFLTFYQWRRSEEAGWRKECQQK